MNFKDYNVHTLLMIFCTAMTVMGAQIAFKVGLIPYTFQRSDLYGGLHSSWVSSTPALWGPSFIALASRITLLNPLKRRQGGSGSFIPISQLVTTHPPPTSHLFS